MTVSVPRNLLFSSIILAACALPFIAGAQEVTEPGQDKLSPRASLKTVITETTYTSAEFLKAKKAFSGWPAKWSINDEGVLVMPGDRVVPGKAPQTFLKAKKAFDEIENPDDFTFVMPGDNTTDQDPSMGE